MASLNTFEAVGNGSLLPSEPSLQPSQSSSGWKTLFTGPEELRAGWRLLIFFVLVFIPLAACVLVKFGSLRNFLEANQQTGLITLTPLMIGGSGAMTLLIICVAALIMSKIEHRKFGEYGFPLRGAFGINFWIGLLSGFAAISGTLFVMYLLHGFRITGLALHGMAIPSAMVAWGMAFLIAGLFEEFLARGYVQYTLASGIGFWPAALAMSFLFGFVHYFNPGETIIGAISAGTFGLLFCWFLRRTGTLWMAVGFHAAWDWGQTLYGVPDSGLLSYHSVFISAFRGPRWLTGGTVGPEASIWCPIALLLAALVFSRFHRSYPGKLSAKL